MTLIASGTAIPAATADRRHHRPFHVYAGLTALVGLDLILFGDRVAGLVLDAPVLAGTLDFGAWFAGMGVGCLLFALVIVLSSRRQGWWLPVAPLMAGTAGVCCLIALAAGWSVLTPAGMAILAVLAATDLLFARLMVRSAGG